jgi:hypothetical protein
MWFYTVIFLLLVVFNGAAYFYKASKFAYIVSLFLLILIAAFRPPTCCADYSTYVDYYRNISDIPVTFLEPTYFIIAYFSKLVFNGPLGIFIVYAIIGVSIKGYALTKLTKYYVVSLLLYFGSFYLLHEMTQIRVGVASGILLLSIPSIVDRKPLQFLVYLIIGTAFHYSFLIFAVFYFLDAYDAKPYRYVLLILFAFAAVAAGLNLASLFELIHLGFISDKINAYKLLLDKGLYGDIKIINPLLFLRISILFFFLYHWKQLLAKNRFSLVIIKIYAFSIFSFIALSDLPSLAGRISQLLGIVEVVLVPYLIYILTPRFYSLIIAVVFALLILYKQLYYSDLMTGYFDF